MNLGSPQRFGDDSDESDRICQRSSIMLQAEKEDLYVARILQTHKPAIYGRHLSETDYFLIRTKFVSGVQDILR